MLSCLFQGNNSPGREQKGIRRGKALSVLPLFSCVEELGFSILSNVLHSGYVQ